ncbi:MAG: hypothetical protein WC677_03805 [Clostridia bacterium]|jgi:hypothetical protein
MDILYREIAEQASEINKSMASLPKAPSKAQKKALQMKTDTETAMKEKIEKKAMGEFATGVAVIQKMGTSWKCSCGSSNSGNFCLSCGNQNSEKANIVSAGAKRIYPAKKIINSEQTQILHENMLKELPPQTVQLSDNSWQCQCGKINKNNFCAGCGNQRQ